jgi:hypothetical protein
VAFVLGTIIGLEQAAPAHRRPAYQYAGGGGCGGVRRPGGALP